MNANNAFAFNFLFQISKLYIQQQSEIKKNWFQIPRWMDWILDVVHYDDDNDGQTWDNIFIINYCSTYEFTYDSYQQIWHESEKINNLREHFSKHLFN